jgi:hypothetical protein
MFVVISLCAFRLIVFMFNRPYLNTKITVQILVAFYEPEIRMCGAKDEK